MNNIKNDPSTLIVAWVITLTCSTLPGILLEGVGIPTPVWWGWAQIALVLAMLLLSMRVRLLIPLRGYFLFLSAYLLLWRAMTVIRAFPGWQEWEGTVSWVAGISAIQGLKLGIAFILLGGLFLVYRQRKEFYFTVGEIRNDAQPVRWLGMRNPTPWTNFGLIIALFFFIGGAVFLWFSNQPPLTLITRTLPLLPFIILISATNGLSEELMFRSSLLAPLQKGISQNTALWMISVFFGLAHYSGTFPGGFIWVFLTGFLGYLFGKSMLETRGLLMPWFLHFISDVPVLFFTAVFSMN